MNYNDTISSFEEYIRSEFDYGDDFEMPKHKIVCPQCHGEGTHGPGFVYTEQDRLEMGDEFYDHMDDLRAGLYNVTCDQCKGQNVINEVDEDALGADLKKEWRDWIVDIREMEDIQRQERMMGA